MRSITPTAQRVLVTLMAVVATVSQVAYLDALVWHVLGLAPPVSAQMRPPFLTLMTAHAVVSVLCAGLAVALVLHEGPRERAARGLGLALGAWSYLTAYSGVTLLLRDPGGSRALFDAHFLVVEVAGLVGLLRFTALFPRPLLDQPLEAPPTLPAVLRPFHDGSVWLLRGWATWVAGGIVVGGMWLLTGVRGVPVGDAGLDPIMDVVRFTATGLVVLNLRRSWGRASGNDVERLTWLLAALVFLLGSLVIFIGGNILIAVARWPEPMIAWRPLLMDVGLIGFVVGLAMAVLYEGALSASGTVRRIASFSAVATLGLFLAAALEALLSGSALVGFSIRTGVGTIVAFAVVISTHRALIRSLERGFSMLPAPGVAEGPA